MNKQKLSIEEKFNFALQNQKNNKLDIAEKLYKEILYFQPNHLNSICYLGIIFVQTKKLDLAKELFIKATQINPDNPSINNNLGSIYLDLGQYQKAISFFEKAIKLKPNYSDAHFNLGIIFANVNNYEKAIYCFEKAIQIQPNDIKYYNILGKILRESGEYKKAISCYEKAINIDKNNIFIINGLFEIFRSIHLSNLNLENSKKIKNLIIFLFKKNIINHNEIFQNAKLLIFFHENQNTVEELIKSKISLLQNKIVQKLIKDDLFLLILQKSFIRDNFLEKLLTEIRKEMLFCLENSNKNNLIENINFIISLAEQSFLNEYVFFQSEKEINLIRNLENKIMNNKNINELELAILGCYIPICRSKIKKKELYNYKSINILFNDMIEMQLLEPLKEKELKKSIKTIKTISDVVSKKVRDQYEENPYPRWRYANQSSKSNFLLHINNDIKPNNIRIQNKFSNPNILIAGCGTGKQLVKACCYDNSNVVGVDLSSTSLAYAKRKINEIGLKNIEFFQGDILHLNNLNRKFDVIECSGVLHHMKEPIKGLKILLDLLEPHGFLHLGLYSKISRKHITHVRELIKKKNLKIV